MNPLGEFRARPSLVLSIRQRRGYRAEYRREMRRGRWTRGVAPRQGRFQAFKTAAIVSKCVRCPKPFVNLARSSQFTREAIRIIQRKI